MNPRSRVKTALLLLGVPLVSGSLAGFPPGFSELPPVTVHIDSPGFSAPVYLAFTLLLLAAAVFLATPRRFGFRGRAASDFDAFEWAFAAHPRRIFPAWGWLGLGLIALSWPAAWTHQGWLGPVADHTFFPLWLGYILTVDALVFRRAGASPLSRNFTRWLALFPASAVTWWYFELLNRFIQNWLYLGAEHFSPLRYVLGATLAFSTVIPAVLTTAALLGTFDWFRTRFVREPTAGAPRAAWAWLAAAGVLGLASMPWFPVPLFALTWLAPWLVLVGLMERAGAHTGVGHMLRGDWGPVLTLAVAALVCGFFWELWNVYAMPKWVYQVPWLDGFKVFEMPLPGYLGYLPFGAACWAFWLLLSPAQPSNR
jgi:hypothetical protein